MWAIVGLIIVILLAVGVGLAIHFDLFGGGDSLASASSAGSAGGQVTVKETVTAQPTNAAGATTKPSAGGAAPTRSSGGEDDQEEPSRGGGGGHTATGGGSDEEPGEPEETGHGTKPAGTKTAVSLVKAHSLRSAHLSRPSQAGSSPTSTGGGGSPPAPGSAEYSTMEVPVPDGATGLAISFASASGDAAGFLEQNGMAISSYSVTAEPIPHTFDKENVVIQDGILQLIVKGGGSDSVSSSEVATSESARH